MSARLSRRQFVKAGLVGSLLLAFAGHATAGGDDEEAMLAAITGAMLAGVLPAAGDGRIAAVAETVGGVRRAVAGLSAQAQKEVGELFSLLSLSAGRRLLAGIAAPWAEAGPDEVAAFLNRWRFGRFALLQGGYAALHDLVLGAWYARPETWAAIGYPGSPEVF